LHAVKTPKPNRIKMDPDLTKFFIAAFLLFNETKTRSDEYEEKNV
jgi:hypothetical protein